MSAKRYQECLRALDRRQPDLTVLMEGVHKPHNLAAIARTGDAVGLIEVHAVTPHPEVGLRRHSASGAHKWMRIVRHRETPGAYAHLRERGFAIICADDSAGSVDYRDIDYTCPTALVVGAELYGLSPRAIEGADRAIKIPMRGMVQSLNVSVASGLVLFEAMRQRERAGMYDRRRLSEETRGQLAFEWLHPKTAAHCRARGMAYPALDEDGDVVWDEMRRA